MVGEHMPEMIGGPQALYRVLQYPESARSRGVHGQVLLNFTVNTDGRPENIKVARGVFSDLDRAAVRAMQQMRFKPAMKDGEAIPVEMNFPVVFRLR